MESMLSLGEEWGGNFCKHAMHIIVTANLCKNAPVQVHLLHGQVYSEQVELSFYLPEPTVIMMMTTIIIIKCTV